VRPTPATGTAGSFTKEQLLEYVKKSKLKIKVLEKKLKVRLTQIHSWKSSIVDRHPLTHVLPFHPLLFDCLHSLFRRARRVWASRRSS
jgi:hypothetical protein